MSCLNDIYEAMRDLFVDCIFCNNSNDRERNENIRVKSKRVHKRHISKSNKSTQTDIIEPGSQ